MTLRIPKALRRFIRDDSGATAVEYGLIAAMIFLAIIGSLTTLGTRLRDSFIPVVTALTN